ncbi:MAG: hypothetical protein RLY63_223 [Chloroflexota bacterium]
MLVAMRLGPPLNGRWRGATRATGVAVAGVFGDFDTGFALWRFAGRLGPPADAPDACVAPFGGSGGPGFTCGRFAGRLGAIFGAPRFTPGFPAEGFGGTSVAVLTTGLASALDTGLAAGFATGFVAGLAAGFAAGFATGFVAGLAAGFAAGFVAGFGVGFAGAGALKRRERMPFFSATGDHHLHEVGNATRVAPLVVVPGDHFRKGSIHHHGALGVDDCGARVSAEIRRDQWFV